MSERPTITYEVLNDPAICVRLGKMMELFFKNFTIGVSDLMVRSNGKNGLVMRPALHWNSLEATDTTKDAVKIISLDLGNGIFVFRINDFHYTIGTVLPAAEE